MKEKPEEAKLVSFRKSATLMFGLVQGLPPCPFELITYLLTASIGGVSAGTMVVLMFGFGTILGLIPLRFVVGGLARATKRTRYSVLVPKICGFGIVIMGIVLAPSPLLE